LDCVKKTFQRYGISGSYQGIAATVLRNIPANFCYFGCYGKRNFFKFPKGLTKDLLTKKGEKPTISTLLVAGGMGGVGYWSLCYPLDIIKSTIQSDSPSDRKYKTISQTAQMIYKEFGVKGFYRGFTPCIVRSFPANAVCFTAYEMTKNKLEKLF
jgi:solute carrier family 25 (mitochondrial carnitine/acylcarnitine transporter), member 20/29